MGWEVARRKRVEMSLAGLEVGREFPRVGGPDSLFWQLRSTSERIYVLFLVVK